MNFIGSFPFHFCGMLWKEEGRKEKGKEGRREGRRRKEGGEGKKRGRKASFLIEVNSHRLLLQFS